MLKQLFSGGASSSKQQPCDPWTRLKIRLEEISVVFSSQDKPVLNCPWAWNMTVDILNTCHRTGLNIVNNSCCFLEKHAGFRCFTTLFGHSSEAVGMHTSADLPVWTRLEYLSNYWMDCRSTLCRGHTEDWDSGALPDGLDNLAKIIAFLKLFLLSDLPTGLLLWQHYVPRYMKVSKV